MATNTVNPGKVFPYELPGLLNWLLRHKCFSALAARVLIIKITLGLLNSPLLLKYKCIPVKTQKVGLCWPCCRVCINGGQRKHVKELSISIKDLDMGLESLAPRILHEHNDDIPACGILWPWFAM